MASITASASVSRAPLVQGTISLAPSSSVVLGLPKMALMGKVRCSIDTKPKAAEKKSINMGAPLLAALASGAMTILPPSALALVDERLSTEGTGLPFGLSNNLLGWILLGMFGLIWSFYFSYTSSLEEDEESGLSL